MGFVVAFDPGDTTGIAWFNDERQLAGFDQIPYDEVPQWWQSTMADKDLDAVVIEDFVLFSKRAKQQSGSRMKASQVIGMLKALAALKNAKVIMQPSSILPIGLKQAGLKMPHNHSETHKYAAYVHGFFYLHSIGEVESALQKEMRENRER